ncbi:hypothetical protein [Thalassospira sp.]|uniref:hypothetical protein n=1 Tax=Thalassospira sp. TaxID=1912094 RepID=UPI0025FBB136|nr:hypothetical protein [Thalassospira sp.]
MLTALEEAFIECRAIGLRCPAVPHAFVDKLRSVGKFGFCSLDYDPASDLPTFLNKVGSSSHRDGVCFALQSGGFASNRLIYQLSVGQVHMWLRLEFGNINNDIEAERLAVNQTFLRLEEKLSQLLDYAESGQTESSPHIVVAYAPGDRIDHLLLSYDGIFNDSLESPSDKPVFNSSRKITEFLPPKRAVFHHNPA